VTCCAHCGVDDDAPDPTDPDGKQWQPDMQLVAAVLAQPRPIRTLASKFDKAWVVAALREDGYSADDIADRLRCSLRAVRTLLADPATKAFRLFFREANTFAEELRLTQHELHVRTVDLAEASVMATEMKAQRDRMIDAAMVGEPVRVCRRAGHVMDRYNTYTDPSTGKTSCRLCRYNATRRARGLPEITELFQLSTAATVAACDTSRAAAGTAPAVTTAHRPR